MRPVPLGATWDGTGTTFAVHSPAAEAVEVCLFDDDGAEHRVPLDDCTHGVWHGTVPGVGPGSRYGLRADGPYDPSRGLRFDPSKLLLDPYARAVEGTLVLSDAVLGADTSRGRRDSAPFVPRGVVVHDAYDGGDDGRPHTPWTDTAVYELHVGGFTARHPQVPAELRGTYAGLAHPAAVGHLVDLGVTAVELLPVQQFVSEPHLLRRGLVNHWGYNTLGFFAPHNAYSSSGSRGQQVGEFQAMVRALHAAGLEVLLDVVYNHTAEGDHSGPTLAWRGLDDAGSYRTEPGDPGRYRDVTGCGNTLDLTAPHVLRMVLDSLRYWVTQMHVDGFRFDLAPALARSPEAFDRRAAFLSAVAQDPVLQTVKLVAEPWDIGEGGYQVGRFPAPWSEWNAEYRDTVRDVWAGRASGVRDLAYRLSGSSDLYQHDGRRPYASVNLVTAHDGFTLRDLTSYDRKHNLANGEDDRDGESHNRSWNCGVEGETDDPQVNALRERQARNLLATLLLSTGVPMLTMGDEVRRTQGGNNNAYCQPDLSLMPWELTPDAAALRTFTARLLDLRRRHPVLRQSTFFLGTETRGDGVKDLAWFSVYGTELDAVQWHDPAVQTLGMYLDGRRVRTGVPRGEALDDDSLFVVLHAGAGPVDVVLPGAPWATSYEVELDTGAPDGQAPARHRAGDGVRVPGRTVLVLRADR